MKPYLTSKGTRMEDIGWHKKKGNLAGKQEIASRG